MSSFHTHTHTGMPTHAHTRKLTNTHTHTHTHTRKLTNTGGCFWPLETDLPCHWHPVCTGVHPLWLVQLRAPRVLRLCVRCRCVLMLRSLYRCRIVAIAAHQHCSQQQCPQPAALPSQLCFLTGSVKAALILTHSVDSYIQSNLELTPALPVNFHLLMGAPCMQFCVCVCVFLCACTHARMGVSVCLSVCVC